MSKKVAIGVDVGGTLTKVGLVDLEGNMYGYSEFSTKNHSNFDQFITELIQHFKTLTRKSSEEITIVGLGVGAPNANYHRGTIEYAANLEWKGVIPIREKLQQEFEQPVYITNDANAAAIGEMIYGKAKGMKDFIVITLGTGLGGGVVSNGGLVYGYDAQAGELGHIVIDYHGRMTGLGRRGGLEAYVSSTGLKRTVFYLLCDSMKDSILRSYSFNDLHGEIITKAAEDGDEIALEAYEMTGEILGKALANFTTFSHPEAFFLLGGLAKAGKWIFEPTQKYLDKYLLPFYKGKVKLSPSGMINKNAAILGSAALVWDHQK